METADPGVLQYTSMQKQYYDGYNRSAEDIVGHYPFHENFPYETQLLFFNGDVRKPIFPEFASRRAFDIACGEGRMIRRMKNFFAEVDGADISETMVNAARERTPGSNVYLTDGVSCGDAASSHYDFVYCTISMQHICVYDVRRSIIKDITRILKPDGKMTLQLLFSKHFPYISVGALGQVGSTIVEIMPLNTHHAGYKENKTGAAGTNASCDVGIGTGDLELVRQDLLELFETVDFWFHDVSIGRTGPNKLPETHPNSHGDDSHWESHYVFMHCTKPRK